MPGIASKRAVSSRAIARRSSAGVEPETIASATFGPTPLTLSRGTKSSRSSAEPNPASSSAPPRRATPVERKRARAPVEIRLDGQLLAVAPQDRRRRLDEIADAVHVEHEARRRQAGALAGEPRDHAAAIRGAVAWQMATASASEAWLFATSTPSTSLTILWICD